MYDLGVVSSCHVHVFPFGGVVTDPAFSSRRMKIASGTTGGATVFSHVGESGLAPLEVFRC